MLMAGHGSPSGKGTGSTRDAATPCGLVGVVRHLRDFHFFSRAIFFFFYRFDIFFFTGKKHCMREGVWVTMIN